MAAESTASADSLSVEPPSSPRSTLRGNPSRHVLFSEVPPKHRATERCRPLCLAIVAWTCLALFAIVLVILLLCVLLAALLHAALPHIALRGVAFTLLDLSRASTVSSTLDFVVEFDNQNDRTAFEFGPLALEASVGRVGLGRVRIDGFSQPARNATLVAASTSVRGVAADAEDIKAGPIAVALKGHVAFCWGRIKFRNVPVMIMCSAVVVADDRRPSKSPCNVRIIPV